MTDRLGLFDSVTEIDALLFHKTSAVFIVLRRSLRVTDFSPVLWPTGPSDVRRSVTLGCAAWRLVESVA